MKAVIATLFAAAFLLATVVVGQQDPQAPAGQRPRKVVAGRGLADPSLLVQKRDRSHGSDPPEIGRYAA